MQTKIVRLITYSNYLPMQSLLLIDLGRVQIHQLIKQIFTLFMLKLHHGLSTIHNQYLFQTNNSIHTYNTRNANHYHSSKIQILYLHAIGYRTQYVINWTQSVLYACLKLYLLINDIDSQRWLESIICIYICLYNNNEHWLNKICYSGRWSKYLVI